MSKRKIRDAIVRTAISIAAVLLVTWISFIFHFNLSAATSLHLFLVTVIAFHWGFLEASIASLVSVACIDYFFTQPLFVFYITDSHDWIALATFESVALLVSRLSDQVVRHARESEVHRSQLQKLYELSQNILLLDPQEPLDQQLANLIQSTLQVRGVVLWNAYNQQLSTAGICDVAESELRSTDLQEDSMDNLEATISRRILHSGTRPIGSLLICGRHMLDATSISATASLTVGAIERERSFSAMSTAEAGRQTEQLRSAVLDGLAHAFKTPLTTIRSSSSGLLEMNTLSGTEKTLVELIDQYAEQLNDLTTRLLRTARVDSADLKLKRERVDLIQLIEKSIGASSQELSDRPVYIQPTARRSIVMADEQLLKMALFQLLDNAAKYGGLGSSIMIDVQEEPSEVIISVRNDGSFIPIEEREKIFQRFYRSPGSDRKASGTGIGLSVVKRVTEAHHGRAWTDSNQQSGTTFFLTLPRMI
ncbi:ATP-binding protein [Granulicella sp. L60]|uniref:sensor histidine kinase n=1 Tax=Granulicella sp. L60 TaxID=1641866 RepID=UPI00131AD009|nr:ATP-binding protein [Granulicella sp. L60]